LNFINISGELLGGSFLCLGGGISVTLKKKL